MIDMVIPLNLNEIGKRAPVGFQTQENHKVIFELSAGTDRHVQLQCSHEGCDSTEFLIKISMDKRTPYFQCLKCGHGELLIWIISKLLDC